MIDKFEVNDCPFCHSHDDLDIDRSGAYAQVVCNDCDARGPSYYTVQQAVDAWNEPTDDLENEIELLKSDEVKGMATTLVQHRVVAI